MKKSGYCPPGSKGGKAMPKKMSKKMPVKKGKPKKK